jgi:ABC-type lipoprotein export system ATPase subunit
MQLLRQIQGPDVALIVVTHDPRVANMAPRRLRLINGALEESVARAA